MGSIYKGQFFGNLEVLYIGRHSENGRATAICQCSCGSEPKEISSTESHQGSLMRAFSFGKNKWKPSK